ncbi:MAG: hypothetical protein FWG18_01915 [Alphaproteobacteria bacterium]|nr:hypothetical protein [Alphaproteobacteria bacterium]
MNTKKIILSTVLGVAVIGVTAAEANYSTPDKYGVVTSVFNPAYRPLENDWAIQSGFAFRTGANEGGNNMTDFRSGDVIVDNFKGAYGIMDNLYVSVMFITTTYISTPAQPPLCTARLQIPKSESTGRYFVRRNPLRLT